MTRPKRLFLYEETMLLALRDENGTVATGYSEFAVSVMPVFSGHTSAGASIQPINRSPGSIASLNFDTTANHMFGPIGDHKIVE